jgi:hypothetical protein
MKLINGVCQSGIDINFALPISGGSVPRNSQCSWQCLKLAVAEKGICQIEWIMFLYLDFPGCIGAGDIAKPILPSGVITHG